MSRLIRALVLGLTCCVITPVAADAHPVQRPELRVHLRAPHGAYLQLDVDPDWARGNYRVVVQQHRVDHWETVVRGWTHGPRDRFRPSVGAGDYRVIVSRPGFPTTTSATARILE